MEISIQTTAKQATHMTHTATMAVVITSSSLWKEEEGEEEEWMRRGRGMEEEEKEQEQEEKEEELKDTSMCVHTIASGPARTRRAGPASSTRHVSGKAP